MEYRYRIGKTRSLNILNDSGFATGCGGGVWNCGTGWTIPGLAQHSGASGFLYQNNVFEPGGEYDVEVVVSAANTNRQIWVYAGEWFCGFTDTNETIRANNIKILSTNTALHIAGVVFSAAPANATVSLAGVFRWDWNDPIEVEPGQWDDASLVIEESSLLPGFITNFISSLKFIKDGYDYLEGRSDEFGAKIPILIEYYSVDSGDWEEFFEGEINVSEMEIDYKTKTAIVDIEQNGAGNFIRTEALDKFQNGTMTQNALLTTLGYSVDGTPAWVQGYDRVLMHSGASDTIQIPVLHQYRGLRDLVVIRSRNRLTVESTFLASAFLDDSGTDIWLGFFRGAQYFGDPATLATDPPDVSTAEVLRNYNNITNMVFWYEKDANGIPTMYIEDFATQVNRTPAITFNNVMLEPMQLAFQYEPKRIDVGYPNSYDGEDELIQYISDEPALTEDLNLQSDWARHTSIMNSLRTGAGVPGGGTIQYAQNILWLEYYDDTGSWRSRRYLAGNFYNRRIAGDLYIDNWTNQLGTTYFSDEASAPDGPLADPLIREFEFNTPIRYEDFISIRQNPVTYVAFNGFGVDTQGLVKRLEYPLKNDNNGDAIARIKILAE